MWNAVNILSLNKSTLHWKTWEKLFSLIADHFVVVFFLLMMINWNPKKCQHFHIEKYFCSKKCHSFYNKTNTQTGKITKQLILSRRLSSNHTIKSKISKKKLTRKKCIQIRTSWKFPKRVALNCRCFDFLEQFFENKNVTARAYI